LSRKVKGWTKKQASTESLEIIISSHLGQVPVSGAISF